MDNTDRSILISMPCRGRSQHVKRILERLAATKSELTTVVVVSNGPERFPDPGLDDIYVVHIGDIPTIPVAVNFGWYALRTPNTVLVKLDNDVEPPNGWEQEIVSKSRVADLGGILCGNEFPPTPITALRGHRMRQPHRSEAWGMPFIYGGLLWIAPELANLLQFQDERFVRSDDGDLGERASRVPWAAAAYSADLLATHLAPGREGSTESGDLLTATYEACDMLIKALPQRPIAQETIWSDCLLPEEASEILLERRELPVEIQARARSLLRDKLNRAFALVGRQALVCRILGEG